MILEESKQEAEDGTRMETEATALPVAQRGQRSIRAAQRQDPPGIVRTNPPPDGRRKHPRTILQQYRRHP
jgi:hypothetical protein